MCGFATLLVLLPLSRGRGRIAASSANISLYQDQLSKLDAQLIDPAADKVTLEQERAELVRRIIRADRGTPEKFPVPNSSRGARTFASLATIVFIPLATVLMYLQIGAPGISDVPVSVQKSMALGDQNVGQLVSRAEMHLRENPNDPRGWRVLANVYGKLGRPDDRARALSHIMRIEGPHPDLLADIAEALTVVKQNIIPVRAQRMFQRALKLDPQHRKARFYYALSLEQEGNFGSARKIWLQLKLLDQNQPEWQKTVGEHLAIANRELGFVAGGPDKNAIQSAARMSSNDRSIMIRSMVAGLAAKLKQNPDNFAGWQRLIRSYTVLGDMAAATIAFAEAKKQFLNRPADLQRLGQLSEDLKLLESTKP